MTFQIIIFLASIFFLVKASDYFVDSGEKIGKYFNIPSFVIGATIIAFGTSLPELVSSLFSIFSGDPSVFSFTIDNIVGSNIANSLIVLGCSLFFLTKKRDEELKLEYFFLIFSLVIFIYFISDGKFTFIEGVFSGIFLIFYLVSTLSGNGKKDKEVKEKITLKDCFIFTFSIIFIFLSAKYLVSSVIEISKLLEIKSSKLTLVAVAIGTSLPEIFVSILASMKGKIKIAIGNIFGSNIFNIFAVSSIPALFGTLQVSKDALQIGVPFLIISLIVLIAIVEKKEFKKANGVILIILYLIFLLKIIGIF